MRYLIEPGKRPDPDDPSGKKKLAYLTVTVWPEPWSLEHTADEGGKDHPGICRQPAGAGRDSDLAERDVYQPGRAMGGYPLDLGL